MQRERIADDVIVFVSDLYAQATATVIVTPEGAILFDTLLYPDETRWIKRFVETRLNSRVEVVILSHHHADHSTGTCFFSGAQVIAHQRCYDLLNGRGRESLENAKRTSPELRDIEIVLPTQTFSSGRFEYRFGNKTLEMWLTPGHSSDSISCLIREDRILLSADTVLPVPYFIDGNYDELMTSLLSLRGDSYEHIVQGHGDIVLRGEVEEKITSDIEYLERLRDAVDKALLSQNPQAALDNIDIESCGKSRILLNGTAPRLHRLNVATLASHRREQVQL